MRLEIIGHSVGAPLGAACSCYAVTGGSTVVLLDFGPGALERVWGRGLLGGIDAIVISHMHMDHMLDLLPLSGEVTHMAGRERRPDYRSPILYLPRDRGRSALDGLARAVGSDPARFRDAFDVREYDDSDAIELGDLRVTFSATSHPEPCYAARVGQGDSAVVYGADGAYSEALVAHAEAADLLLLEATYVEPGPELERNGHMTGEQAGLLAERAGARRLVLTHIGPWPDRNEENLRRARAHFRGDVELAKTGSVYSL